MIYSETISTRVEDFDSCGRMTLPALLQIIENTCTHHAAQVGIDIMGSSLERGISWVTTDWRVELSRLPSYRDKLVVETWVCRRPTTTMTTREAKMRTAEGEVLVCASLKLAMLNIRSGEVLLDPTRSERFDPETYSVFSQRLPRLRVPARFDSEQAISLRRRDMDYNGHLHNTTYLDLALEILPESVLEEGVRRVRILYRRPVRRGEELVLRGCRHNEGWATVFFVGETACAVVAFNEQLKPLGQS